MFTIGEFSRLAQVSNRLLRYYDEIGLLKPAHTDRFTGYRYYSAAQLPELNRILALRDLGLSLEQVQRILRDRVSTEEIQGMLLLKKAEIEQHLQAEARRIRNIEARLQFIRNAEASKPLDVVVKQIPAQPILSVRTVVESMEAGQGILGQIMSALPEKNSYGLFFVIWHSGGPFESNSEAEIGRLLSTTKHPPVPLQGGLQLTYRELPAVETMATYVLQGSVEKAHIAYGEIGIWAEVNGYRFADAPRELVLHLPQEADGGDAITEIQYPLEPVGQP